MTLKMTTRRLHTLYQTALN